jgi:hypothetical protein
LVGGFLKTGRVVTHGKNPDAEKSAEILKRLTPEQRKAIQTRVSDVFANARRSRFKLVGAEK